jgi:hypothetical protein
MSHLFATAGSKLYIGQAKAFNGTDFIASDFNGQSWTEIGGTTNLGAAGDTSELISSNQVGAARTRKLKGTRNAGSMAVVADLDYADAGQVALIAAEKTRHAYAFKIVLNDAPVGGTPSERYFVALVMSASEQWNEANSVTALNATLEIDSNIVRVSAAATGSAPDNTVLPAITGTATEGQTLTASSGTWTGSPAPAYSYQWFGDGESLPGATSSTLALTEDHVGLVITVQVTATNVNGSASAISANTSAVTGA